MRAFTRLDSKPSHAPCSQIQVRPDGAAAQQLVRGQGVLPRRVARQGLRPLRAARRQARKARRAAVRKSPSQRALPGVPPSRIGKCPQPARRGCWAARGAAAPPPKAAAGHGEDCVPDGLLRRGCDYVRCRSAGAGRTGAAAAAGASLRQASGATRQPIGCPPPSPPFPPYRSVVGLGSTHRSRCGLTADCPSSGGAQGRGGSAWRVSRVRHGAPSAQFPGSGPAFDTRPGRAPGCSLSAPSVYFR